MALFPNPSVNGLTQVEITELNQEWEEIVRMHSLDMEDPREWYDIMTVAFVNEVIERRKK